MYKSEKTPEKNDFLPKNSTFDKVLEHFLHDPGFIKEIRFTYDVINKFTCHVMSADSQPEFYEKTAKRAMGRGKSVLEASMDALQKLKEQIK